jgi:hypothetical protein
VKRNKAVSRGLAVKMIENLTTDWNASINNKHFGI